MTVACTPSAGDGLDLQETIDNTSKGIGGLEEFDSAGGFGLKGAREPEEIGLALNQSVDPSEPRGSTQPESPKSPSSSESASGRSADARSADLASMEEAQHGSSGGWGRAVEAGGQGDEAMPGTTHAGGGAQDDETAAQHIRQGSSSSLGSSSGPNRRMPVASDGSGRRLCYDFTHARCMRGDHCRFAHVPATWQQPQQQYAVPPVQPQHNGGAPPPARYFYPPQVRKMPVATCPEWSYCTGADPSAAENGCQGYYGSGERILAPPPVPGGFGPGPVMMHLPYLPPPQPQQPYYAGYYQGQAAAQHPPVHHQPPLPPPHAPVHAPAPSPVPSEACVHHSSSSPSGQSTAAAPASRVFRLPWLKKSTMAVDPVSKRKICFCECTRGHVCFARRSNAEVGNGGLMAVCGKYVCLQISV